MEITPLWLPIDNRTTIFGSDNVVLVKNGDRQRKNTRATTLAGEGPVQKRTIFKFYVAYTDNQTARSVRSYGNPNLF